MSEFMVRSTNNRYKFITYSIDLTIKNIQHCNDINYFLKQPTTINFGKRIINDIKICTVKIEPCYVIIRSKNFVYLK